MDNALQDILIVTHQMKSVTEKIWDEIFQNCRKFMKLLELQDASWINWSAIKHQVVPCYAIQMRLIVKEVEVMTQRTIFALGVCIFVLN